MSQIATADPGQSTGSAHHQEPTSAGLAPASQDAGIGQELDCLEAMIDALPDERMPGEMPVSLDGRTGSIVAIAGNRAARPAPELTGLSINNPLALAPDDAGANAGDFDSSRPHPHPHPNRAAAPGEIPEPGPDDEPDDARKLPNGAPFPQFRLRPTSELDRQVYSVQKALGVDVERAVAIVRERAGAAAPETGELTTAEAANLEAELDRARASYDNAEAQLESREAALDRALEAQDAAAAEALRAELKTLRAQSREARARGQQLLEARERLELAQAGAQARAEAEFDRNLELVARVYPEIADPHSALRQAMADVQARWEQLGEHEKLNSPRKPQLAVAEARQEMALDPARYARTKPAVEAAATADAAIPSYEYPRMRPAPGRAGSHPGSPSRFGEAVERLGTTHDLDELLAGV